jgi:ubiquinone/menaquinone biosynthesis C-methylase UbiE
MSTSEDLKNIVKEKYSEIAVKNSGKITKCGCCGDDPEVDITLFSDDYSKLDGYVPEADLNLGCGIPTQYAAINHGDTVVDLGSGAGNDVFVARSIVGQTGKVVGIDFTEDMINKAQMNNQKLGFDNVEFKLGDIENLPIDDNSVDVVVSNCVLNLVPDKTKAFQEIFRILKPGAHLCVSDIVTRGKLPEALKRSAELYAGCVAGAVDIEEYIDIMHQAGIEKHVIHKEIKTELPLDLLKEVLNEQELKNMLDSEVGIYSITVSGYKS